MSEDVREALQRTQPGDGVLGEGVVIGYAAVVEWMTPDVAGSSPAGPDGSCRFESCPAHSSPVFRPAATWPGGNSASGALGCFPHELVVVI